MDTLGILACLALGAINIGLLMDIMRMQGQRLASIERTLGNMCASRPDRSQEFPPSSGPTGPGVPHDPSYQEANIQFQGRP